MWVSVGQLYSAQKLLEWVDGGGYRPEEITAAPVVSVFVCPADDVLDVVMKAAWAAVDLNGVLRVTARGRIILGLETPTACLRAQLADLISVDKPVWSKLIPKGRKELTRSAPNEVVQILDEAGLLESPVSDSIVSWWDQMADLARGMRAAQSLSVGRNGERLTLKYEFARTKVEPHWQCIESNISGFDVLSVHDESDDAPLRIEVKASSNKINAAEFYVTRNEWDTACSIGNYVFHLWQVAEVPRLAVVSSVDLDGHIPKDNGQGIWQSVRVPFSAFREKFTEIRFPSASQNF